LLLFVTHARLCPEGVRAATNHHPTSKTCWPYHLLAVAPVGRITLAVSPVGRITANSASSEESRFVHLCNNSVQKTDQVLFGKLSFAEGQMWTSSQFDDFLQQEVLCIVGDVRCFLHMCLYAWYRQDTRGPHCQASNRTKCTEYHLIDPLSFVSCFPKGKRQLGIGATDPYSSSERHFEKCSRCGGEQTKLVRTLWRRLHVR